MAWNGQPRILIYYIIENVWHKIKHELQKHVKQITSRQLLETVIHNIWTEIHIDYIQDLYKSIPKHLKQ